MSRKKITAKQYEFLQFLIDHTEETGVWPTYQEIIDHFGYKSPNSVTQNLKALKKKGHLEYDEDRGYHLADQHRQNEPAGIPVTGTVSAGTVHEAEDAEDDAITLDALFPDLNNLFAVRVSDQSLNNGTISDGDYVLLKDEEVTEGGVGAVLHDNQLSLKRVYRSEDELRLAPVEANPPDGMVRAPEDVQVLGQYVGYANADGIFRRAVHRSDA